MYKRSFVMRNNSQRLQRFKYYRYIFDSSINIFSSASVLCSSRALNVTFGESARARARGRS